MMVRCNIQRFSAATSANTVDLLAVEEPLELRLEYGDESDRIKKNISITMRTPGQDEDLVRGFLFTEGIVRQKDDILSVQVVTENVVMAILHPDLAFDMSSLDRHFYTTSSCGVCGKSSIEALQTTISCVVSGDKWDIDPAVIYTLPEKLRKHQETFEATGGLHAAAIFDTEGLLIAIREDVGRHNALDKLIGHFVAEGSIPLDQHILLLSGRASFELVQKAAMAGIRTVCAVGAPSSLAVASALTFGITLIGFLRGNRFNVYGIPE